MFIQSVVGPKCKIIAGGIEAIWDSLIGLTRIPLSFTYLFISNLFTLIKKWLLHNLDNLTFSASTITMTQVDDYFLSFEIRSGHSGYLFCLSGQFKGQA